MLALLIAVLVTMLIVLSLVLGPLLKPARAPATREAFDRAVYRDQLKELEREVARGAVAESEAATARLELQRRLLAADSEDKAAPGGARKPLLAAALAFAIVLIAGGLYLRLGVGQQDRAPGLRIDAAGPVHRHVRLGAEQLPGGNRREPSRNLPASSRHL